MKFSIYGWYFLPFLVKHLENEGHSVLLNNFSKDVDVCITENIMAAMYDVYINLKDIKKNHIKLINFIAEVPMDYKMQKNNPLNTPYKNVKQTLYNITHRNKLILNYVNYFTPNPRKSKIFNLLSCRVQDFFNTRVRNRIYYQKHYRRFLKNSDLNLSMSKFTQILVKRFLKLNSKVCYPCVNSDFLLNLPKSEIIYDAINISRISKRKRQTLFIEAAKKLDLNILVLGRHQEKSIILECPHLYIKDRKKVMKILNQTKFYVAPSIFEGFGMTPIEAAFLDKITIASDIYVHRDVLGEYPLYFKKDNVHDLVDKMRIVMDGGFKLNNKKIKEKYSIQAFKNRLMKHIESLL